MVEDADRPFLTRGAAGARPGRRHLLGDDAPDAGAGRPDRRGRRPIRRRWPTQLAARWPAGVRLVHLRERGRGTGAGGRGRGAASGRIGGARPRPGPVRGAATARGDGWPSWRSGRRCCAAPGWSPDRSRRWPRPAPDALRRLTAGGRAGAAGRTEHLGPAVVDREPAAGRRAGARPAEERAGAVGARARRRIDAGARPGAARRAPRARPRARSAGPSARPRRRPGCAAVRSIGRRPAPRRPRAERRRAGTARPADRAGGRLGRPRARRRPCAAALQSWPPGPGTATRCSPTGGCAAAAAAGTASPRCSPATRAPARRCRPR